MAVMPCPPIAMFLYVSYNFHTIPYDFSLTLCVVSIILITTSKAKTIKLIDDIIEYHKHLEQAINKLVDIHSTINRQSLVTRLSR